MFLIPGVLKQGGRYFFAQISHKTGFCIDISRNLFQNDGRKPFKNPENGSDAMTRTANNTRSTEIDIIHGPIGRGVLRLAVPIALTQMLQQLFNAADVAVVGQFSGKNAMAAIGSNSPLIGLIVTLFFGISVGSTVVIAHRIGLDDRKGIGRAVGTSILLALAGGVLALVIGEIFAVRIMTAMSVPAETFALAVLYFRIYLMGMPVILLYNFESAIFRSYGDAKTPLISLIIAGITNVALNLFFVCVVGMSVEGVAIATVISNALSAGILFRRLAKNPDLELKNSLKAGFDREMLRRIIGIGLPAGIQGTMFSVSNIIIQSAINQLGPDVMAASAAAFNIEIMGYFVMNGFAQACTTFVGQNYGAGRVDRCRTILWKTLLMDLAATAAASGIILLTGRFLLSLFNSDPAIISLGYLRLLFISGTCVIQVFIEVISGALRGYGFSVLPAIVAIFGICGVRVGWVYTFFARAPAFRNLLYSYPISWAATAAAMVVVYFVLTRNLELSTSKQEAAT